MRLSKKAIKPLAKIHGYWLYKTFLNETEHWDLDEKRGYVERLLLETLVQANDNVPFYRRRFREVGFDPKLDFEGVETMNQLPTLTKQELREHADEMVDSRFVRHSVTATTSGSTGEPTRLRLSARYVALDYACMFRHWAKAGYSFGYRFGAFRTYAPKKADAPFWKFSRIQNTVYFSAYQLRPDTYQDYMEVLLRYKPKFLRGYPSALAVFADLAFEDRNRLSFVRGVFTASETLGHVERESIERTFGPVAYDWYGMTEPAVVITERREQDCMRVEWFYGFPEFLKSRDDSNLRSLVATSLHNPVMPLIRYETGDAIELLNETPEIGELYPDIRAVFGRKDQVIRTPEGGRLPSLSFYSLLQEYGEILRFQFIQDAIDRVEVRLLFRMAIESKKKDVIVRALDEEIGARLGPSICLGIGEATSFVRSGEGKINPFVVRDF